MDPVSLKCCVDGKGKADCTQTVQLAGHRAGALEGPSQGLLPVASRTLRVGGVPHPPTPPPEFILCVQNEQDRTARVRTG